jgi:Tfp pilus assembly protein PilN
MKRININLLPPEIKAKRETEKNLAIIGLFAVITAGILFLVAAYFRLGIASEQSKLDSLVAQNAAIEAQIGQYKEFEQKKVEFTKLQEIYSRISQNRVSWYRFLIEIALITPEQISIKNLSADMNAVMIQGDSTDVQSIADFIVRLEDLSELEEVWLDSLNSSGERNSFIIKATFKPEGAKL